MEMRQELNCGHPLCGKGYHLHTDRATEPPPSVVRKESVEVKKPPASGIRQSVATKTGSATCSKCGKLKPSSEFYRSSGTKCRDCWNAYHADRRRHPKSPDQIKAEKKMGCFGCGKHRPFYRQEMCRECWDTPFESIEDVRREANRTFGEKAENPVREAGIVMLSGFIVGTDIERLTKFTTFPEETVRKYAEGLKKIGLWVGDDTFDLDELMGLAQARKHDVACMNLNMYAMGACGMVVRTKNKEGKSLWALEPSFKKAWSESKGA